MDDNRGQELAIIGFKKRLQEKGSATSSGLGFSADGKPESKLLGIYDK